MRGFIVVGALLQTTVLSHRKSGNVGGKVAYTCCLSYSSTWQIAWDDGDTGMLIHNIIPKVRLQPINWTGKEVLFFTGHGLFPLFLQRSTLPKPHFVLVGESAHQSIMLRFASSQPPTIRHHPANNISQYGSAA
ncbi:hypothetical protein AVEN_133754-1 [Araneus ventricosus]|uniref:Uncharacterized protein n=1 Tax=Araneus ventricosus TaxID=182803 RepID=A0A4Y2B7R9_ARAVE|nr:hypothetical protein AVEN_133754-1 [Araneus ventricosus]